jgi:fructose-1,6-bisphosphatase
MPRGGYRWDGKPSWKQGKTETVRVPTVLKNEVLAIAHALDDGLAVNIDDGSNIDVSQVNQVGKVDDATNELVAKSQMIRQIVSKYKSESKDTPRWDKANKLIAELEPLSLY